MENASKALLMAAGVLLSILVISIGVLFYNNLSSPTESYVAKLDATELQKYNSPFEVYMSRTDVTAQEIVTMVSESKQKDQNIQVKINNMPGYENMQQFTTEQLNNFLDENIQYIEEGAGKLVYFKCKSVDYGEDGRVNYIELEKVGTTIDNPVIVEPDSPVAPPPNKTKEEEGDEETPTGNSAPYFANTSLFTTNVIDTDGDWTKVYATVEIFTFGTDSSRSLKKQQSSQSSGSSGGSSGSYGGSVGGGFGGSFGGSSSNKGTTTTTIKVDPAAYVKSPSSSVFYYKDYINYAKDPSTIPNEYWATITYEANGSKDWADDFKSKQFKISTVNLKGSTASTSYYATSSNEAKAWYYVYRVKFYAKDEYHDEWVVSDYYYKVYECPGTIQVGRHYEQVEKVRDRDRVIQSCSLYIYSSF